MRVLRIAGRLNVGGPAIQAIELTRRLEPLGYDTTLVSGVEGPDEGSMGHLAQERRVTPVRLNTLRRELGSHDLRAILSLARLIRTTRPDIVHTHQAKAGAAGRLAAQLAGRRTQPALIHTFHGHVLSGYFSPRQAAAFRWIERGLARRTDRLVAVSDEVRDDLVELGVATRDDIEVVPLGFELGRFRLEPDAARQAREALRTQLRIPLDATVVTLVARLVPIKRVDRFLEIASGLTSLGAVHFLIVGDGELRGRLHGSESAAQLGKLLTWAGMRHDMPAVLAASDIVCLTSDNEGTPVSLIEAQAAGRPVVATDVGGVRSAVEHESTGFLVNADDTRAFRARIRELVGNPTEAGRMGDRGPAFAAQRFSIDRLVSDIDRLYRAAIHSGPGRQPGSGAVRRRPA